MVAWQVRCMVAFRFRSKIASDSDTTSIGITANDNHNRCCCCCCCVAVVSAYPVHITKYFKAPRLVLFCGLEDYVGSRGPDSRPEPYIYQMPSLTPPAQIFGVGGLHGGCCSNWMTNWGPAGLNLPGQVGVRLQTLQSA